MPDRVCSRCGYPDDGSAYGCDCDPPIVLVPRPPSRLESATARVALLEGLLREVEWNCPDLGSGDCEGRCPWCQARRADGHTPDCRLAAALADGG